MTLPDFRYRQQIHDRFAVGVIQSKKQILVDVHNLLGEAPPNEAEKEE